MVMLTSGLLAGVLALLYQERLAITNQLLKLSGTPYDIRVGKIDGDRSGSFQARDLIIRSREHPAAEPLLNVPEADWQLRWREAVGGRITELVLRRPTVTIGPTQWRSLEQWLLGDPRPPEGPVLSTGIDQATGTDLAPAVDRLRIENARLDLEIPGLPRIRGRLDYRGNAIGLFASPTENIRAGGQNLTLRDLEISLPTSPDQAALPELLVPQIDLTFKVEQRVLTILDWEITGPSLELSAAQVENLLAILAPGDAPAESSEQTSPLAEPTGDQPTPPWIDRIEWGRIALSDALIQLHPGLAAVDEISIAVPGLSSGIDLASEDGHWDMAGGMDPGAIEGTLTQVALSLAGQDYVRLDRAGLNLQLGASLDIDQIELLHPEIRIGGDSLRLLSRWSERLATDNQETSDPDLAWSVRSLQITGGRLRVGNLGPGIPGIRAGIDATLVELANPGPATKDSAPLALGFASDALQTVTLTDLEIAYSEDDPFFAAETVDLEAIPEALLQEKRINRLIAREPVITINRSSLAPLFGGGEPAATEGVAPPEGMPVWHGWWIRELTLAHGRVEAADLPFDVPDFKADLRIATDNSPDEKGPVHLIALENFEGSIPDVAATPIAKLERAALRLQPLKLWEEGNLGTLDLLGAGLQVGSDLRDHFAAEPEAGEPTTDTGTGEQVAEPFPNLHLENLILRESMLTLGGLAPGLPDVPISLNLETKRVPLTAEGMSKDSNLIKLELGTALLSPIDMRYVIADLHSVFVHFTLAGLLKQEIERVQIIAPELNIGEHLFSFIERYRATSEETESSGVKPPTGPLPEAEEEMFEPGGWDIRRIEVESGQLVVAPKGVALFPNPFPFSAVTELSDGRINASFVVPRDDYSFEQLDLELEGLAGKVLFHLPAAGEDNNLVEVLEAERIRWRDFEATNAFLSIAYDRFGIYIGLGGEAYEGYMNAKFNIYLEHLYNWDGWLTFTGIEMRDLTEIISPEYFLMNGVVDLELVAQGNLEELFEAYGDLSCSQPGTIRITQVEAMLESLPDDWSTLKREITRLGMEPLRKFDYDQGEGSFTLLRTGADVSLKLEGEQGVRAFDVEVHGQPLSMFIEPLVPAIEPPDAETRTPNE